MVSFQVGQQLKRCTGFCPQWGGPPTPYLEIWTVEKVTPKGAWVTHLFREKPKWIRNSGRWAREEDHEAVADFYWRRKREIQHLLNSLHYSMQQLTDVETYMKKPLSYDSISVTLG